jgi:hypothetical protein
MDYVDKIALEFQEMLNEQLNLKTSVKFNRNNALQIQISHKKFFVSFKEDLQAMYEELMIYLEKAGFKRPKAPVGATRYGDSIQV